MLGVPIAPIVRGTHQLETILSKFDLIGLNGRDDMRVEACEKFLDDDSFIKSQGFMEFAYRAKRDEYVKIMAIERSLHLEFPYVIIWKKVLNEMRNKFQKMIAKDGRELVRTSGILLLLEWDLAFAIAFDTI